MVSWLKCSARSTDPELMIRRTWCRRGKCYSLTRLRKQPLKLQVRVGRWIDRHAVLESVRKTGWSHLRVLAARTPLLRNGKRHLLGYSGTWDLQLRSTLRCLGTPQPNHGLERSPWRGESLPGLGSAMVRERKWRAEECPRQVDHRFDLLSASQHSVQCS